MKVLMITSEWPTSQNPDWVPFVRQEVEKLKEFGVQVDVFPFRGAMRWQNYVQAWLEFRRCLRMNDYHLVHAQFGQSGLLAIFPKSIPLIVSYRGSDLNGMIGINGRMTFIGLILRRLSQLVALRADEIIVVSKKLSGFLPVSRYHVIPSGLNLELFKPQPQTEARQLLNLDFEKHFVLFAGNPANPIKRFPLAEEAVRQVNSIDRSVEMLIARGVPPTQMPLYMNASDVLLLTSAHEGSPNMVKEALACNLPVVAVDVGDVRERIGNVDGCIICKSDKPDVIASALKQVVEQRQRIEGRVAVQDLDVSTITRKVIDVYSLALKRA